MITFPYVEDFLEALAGHDPSSPLNIITPPSGTLFTAQLARYDVKIVDSMSTHTIFGGSLTDRQAALTVSLILKYKRQFAKAGIDVSSMDNPVFRRPVRIVDRSRRLWINDEMLVLRFPYERQLIDDITAYKKISQGRATFLHDDKLWEFGITEGNVSWLCTWAQMNNIAVAPEVQTLFDAMLEIEKVQYKIELIQTEDGYTVTNAANSMLEYLSEKVGMTNLTGLVDYAGVLGYTISDAVYNLVANNTPEVLLFGENRQFQMAPTVDHFGMDAILDYAKAVGRYPVCVYDPGMSSDLSSGFDFSRFAENEIVRFNHSGKTATSNYDINNVKLVYANKIPSTWNHPVPLLVSTVEMMYGGKRMLWLNSAEKIIFYCNTKLREMN